MHTEVSVLIEKVEKLRTSLEDINNNGVKADHNTELRLAVLDSALDVAVEQTKMQGIATEHG